MQGNFRVRIMGCRQASFEEMKSLKGRTKDIERQKLCMNCGMYSLEVVKRNEYKCGNCGKGFTFMSSSTSISAGCDRNIKEGFKNGS